MLSQTKRNAFYVVASKMENEDNARTSCAYEQTPGNGGDYYWKSMTTAGEGKRSGLGERRRVNHDIGDSIQRGI